MAGHSKWANIKRKKELQDKEKGSRFSKLSHQIIQAVKEGGEDPESNISLRFFIQQAKKANMPNASIQRSIQTALSKSAEKQEMVEYEAFGPCGVALIIFTQTENKNRTVASLRQTLSRFKGTLAQNGSTKCFFRHCLEIKTVNLTEENVLQFVDKVQAFEFRKGNEGMYFYSPIEQLNSIINDETIDILEGPDLIYFPKVFIHLNKNQQSTIQELIKALEEDDDVLSVFANMT